jgi:RNA polymerase sigma-70 factor (ECF subfamily)
LDTRERWQAERLGELRDLYHPLRRFAAVIGRWDVDPDDLVQDAYARVLVRDPESIEDLGPYLRRTIVHLATDERRRFGRATTAFHRLRSVEPTDDSYPSDLDDLMRLQPRVRALLYLVEIEGAPITEAAELLGMSPGNARVTLGRARRRLRAEITEEATGG